MGKGYLIDSNLIIDFISLKLPDSASDYVEHLFNTNFIISVAVKIEVLGFDYLPEKLLRLEEFINSAIILPLDDAVTNQAISLRRNYRKLKLGDAIIAATAIEFGLTLATHNTKDFVNIKGLRLFDPYTIK